jgi:UrcA family protein
MKTQTLKKGILGSMVAILGTLAVATAAQAGEGNKASAVTHESVVVRYGDLNLRSADGARALYARLESAADRACGNAPSAQEMWRRQEYRACFEAAMDKAVKKVGSVQVQALHTAARPSTSVG